MPKRCDGAGAKLGFGNALSHFHCRTGLLTAREHDERGEDGQPGGAR
jgi:hypothetical protein